ncbi:MAG: hypothetical protein IKS24_01005 [Bacteroidaceae bacterium]|nr:hypothetical protein [Bacteroidaceae bacterium]
MITKYKSFLLAIILIVFAGCEDKENEGKIEFDPEAVTQSVGNLEMFTATIYGKLVLPDIKQENFTFGFEYSTDETFSSMKLKRVECVFFNSQMENMFSSTLKNLAMATEYYYRAYITYKGVTYYGEMKSFVTKGVEVVTGDMDPDTYEVTSKVEMGADFERVRYGLCFGATENLTVDNSTIGTNEAQEDGNYTLALNNIPYGEFFYRAYVTVNGVTHYGEVKRLEGNKVITGEIDLENMTVSAWVRYYKGYDDFSYGVCFGKSSSPTKEMDKSVGGGKFDSDNNFVARLTRIPFGKVYYRAYISIGQKVYYGETYSFEHKMIIGEPVDLGLSVKWADMNIGADNDYDYGIYLPWAETEEKEGSAVGSYKYAEPDTRSGYEGNYLYNKYTLSYDYSVTVDGKTVLEPMDDAATVLWGDGWRMPSVSEFEELLNKCTLTWMTKSGVNGFEVLGPNGNSIFLPAGGGYMRGELVDEGSAGAYWTNELFTMNQFEGYSYQYDFAAMYFYMGQGGIYKDWYYRYYMYSVRPVYTK